MGRKDTSVLFLSGPPPLVAGSGGPTDIVALHKNTEISGQRMRLISVANYPPI